MRKASPPGRGVVDGLRHWIPLRSVARRPAAPFTPDIWPAAGTCPFSRGATSRAAPAPRCPSRALGELGQAAGPSRSSFRAVPLGWPPHGPAEDQAEVTFGGGGRSLERAPSPLAQTPIEAFDGLSLFQIGAGPEVILSDLDPGSRHTGACRRARGIRSTWVPAPFCRRIRSAGGWAVASSRPRT